MTQGCFLRCLIPRYLDFTAGIAVNALGHGHPAVQEAIENQLKTGLVHTSNLFHTRPAALLAERLIRACHSGSSPKGSGFDADKVFLCNSGTEANEAALKFVRKYGLAVYPQSPKFKVLSFQNAFHGRTFGSLSATPTHKYQYPFQPLLSGFKYAEFNDLDSVTQAMDDDTCAIMVEPLQGEGGIHQATPEFLRGLRALCDQYGALLIFDEIQCGLGRTGAFFAHTASGVFPDLVTIAKPMANGIPIGAVLLSPKVAAQILPGDHGTTFGGGPLVSAVANKVISILQEPAFLENVRSTGQFLKEQLEKLKEKYPNLVSQVRGRGLMVGMELKVDPNAKFVDIARGHGLLVCTAGKNVVRLVPPLIVSRDQIQEAVNMIDKTLEELQ